MTYWYRNNHYITVNSFNEYFAIWLSYAFCMREYAFICFFNFAWYQISEISNGTKSFLFGRRETYTYMVILNKGVYCLLTWTEQCFIPSAFDSRCCVEEIAVPCQESFAERELGLWYYLQQMLWKHLNEALLDNLHHQIQIVYIHCSQVALIKLIFDHKIYTSLNHETCLLANDCVSNNAIKKWNKYKVVSHVQRYGVKFPNFLFDELC